MSVSVCNFRYKETLVPLKLGNIIKYNLGRFPNKIEVCPHSKFINTSCPGKNVGLFRVKICI